MLDIRIRRYRQLANNIVHIITTSAYSKTSTSTATKTETAVDTKLLMFFIFFLYNESMSLNFHDFRNMKIFMEKKT